LKILELILSANPKDVTVSKMGIQHFTPNFRQNNPIKTTYKGMNAHLLLRNITTGEAHR
jgi:hypothetical protein